MTPLTKRMSEIKERLEAMSAGQISGAASRAFYLRDVPMLLEAVEQCVEALEALQNSTQHPTAIMFIGETLTKLQAMAEGK